MYSVYINHFKRDNSLVDTEELMFAVPINNNAHINKPMVKSSEDSADSFSFSMESNSPYYDAILPYKTMIRVEYDGDVIFWGRALAPSTSSVLHTKTVQCNGTYSFFNDSYYEGVQDKHKSKITVSEYLTKIINNHNDMVPDKQIFRGEVGITLPTKTEKYEPTSWTQSSSLLSDLTSNNGGHMRIRYTNEDAYLDWYQYYVRDLGDGVRPSVKIGKNILDISSEANNNNRFTRVIPIGSTNSNGKSIYIDGYKYKDKDNVEHTYSGKAMPVSFIRTLYTSSELTDDFHDWKDYRDAEADYGIIYKTMSFSDSDSQKSLFDEVKKWIKDSYFRIASSFTVKAIDMHILDGTIPKILFGDCVDVTFLMTVNGANQWITKKLVCKAVQYDLYNPENNSYTFGVPSDLLDAASRHKSSKTVSESTGTNNRKPSSGSEDEDITWRKVWQMIGTLNGDSDYEGTNAAMSFYNNGELSGTVYCIDPDEITTGTASEKNEKKFDARLIGKIALSGKSVKWVAVSSDRGIFAYTDNRYTKSVSHWYSKKKGYKYDGAATGESTFDKIATLIEKDTNANWGGSTAATSFRSNGKISGSANKCYDSIEHTAAEARSDSSLVFSADIVGKFTLNGANKYVALSQEYGIFGFSAQARDLIPALHWYEQVKGVSYDNTQALISEENGDTYATDDGTPDGNKTIWFKPTELTGQGSQGQAVFGYDTTGTSDKWRIELNVPIQYIDADGQTQIADGFVSASDFHVEEIPSFKTKIGIFDIVIAGKIEAQQISADLAELRKMLGDVIIANTGVRTDKLWANTISAKTYAINVPSEGGSGYDTGYLNNCFSNCLASAGTGANYGKICLDFYKIGGGLAQSVNFNIADTQFYKDSLDSARSAVSIGSIVYTAQSGDTADTSLDPGEWAKAQGTFVNQSGQTVTTTSYKLIKANTDSNLTAGNIKKDVTIFGIKGTCAPESHSSSTTMTLAGSYVESDVTYYIWHASINRGKAQGQSATFYW